MADALRERVRSGAYASESEVIRDGLRPFFAPDGIATADGVRAKIATKHTER